MPRTMMIPALLVAGMIAIAGCSQKAAEPAAPAATPAAAPAAAAADTAAPAADKNASQGGGVNLDQAHDEGAGTKNP